MKEPDQKEKARKAQLVNAKSWRRAIKLDQKSGKKFADNLDSCVSNMIMPKFQTKEFESLMVRLVGEIKFSIDTFEKAGMGL